MHGRVDHIVFWVKDMRRSLDFYCGVMELEGVRVDEFHGGKAPFPSVRVSADSVIDLMLAEFKPGTEALTKTEETAGFPVNHLCLALSRSDFEALIARLEASGIDTSARLERSFGARGIAPHTVYFPDPDNNVIEARYYE
jgi:catechol 2,3-dioxygenase-like lactoylglutathione lyase family enzyme